MKKNLNIAYLNGAEGMIRRGASGGSGESGGSGSGSGSGESGNAYPTKYYKVLDSSVINVDLMLWLSGGIVDLIGPKPAGFFVQDESYNQYITKISFNPVNDFNGRLCHTIEELTNNDENILSKLESITEEEYYSE